MQSAFARVAALDRPNRRAWVLSEDFPSGPLMPVATYGEPPPPLSRVEIVEYASGQWACLSEIGAHRVLVHDDFTRCPTLAPGATVLAADTGWRTTVPVTGGAIYQYASVFGAGTGLGECVIGTGTPLNSQAIIRKDNDACAQPTAPDGLWVSGKFRDLTNGASTRSRFGLIDDAQQDAVLLFYSGSTALTTQCAAAGSSTFGASPEVLNGGVDGWTTFDIVVVAGMFGAFWVNGDGPNVLRTNVPTAPLTLNADCINLLVGNVRLTIVDYLRLVHVVDAIDPTAIEGATRQGLAA